MIRIQRELNDKLTIVHVGARTLYFSYETLIAFEKHGELFISKNIWSNTTGRHLNWIDDDKEFRMDNDKFMEFARREL